MFSGYVFGRTNGQFKVFGVKICGKSIQRYEKGKNMQKRLRWSKAEQSSLFLWEKQKEDISALLVVSKQGLQHMSSQSTEYYIYFFC